MMRCLVCLLALLVAATIHAADHTKDSLDTVKQGVASGKAVLVDVRELEEWADGHVKGAKHLALSTLKKGQAGDKLKEQVPSGKIVYLHCAAGVRCLIAANLLKDAGYDIRPLKPGYDALIKAGFKKE
jgi:phage shock protein E